MVKIERKKRHLSPTTRFISQKPGQEGRLTDDGFRLMKDLAEFISLIEIEDGEIKTEMLEAEIIRVSTLIADEIIITSKVAQNAISEISVGQQAGSKPPNGTPVVTITVPVDTTFNTGVILTFTAVQGLPPADPGNVGSYQLSLRRNGTTIAASGPIFYDDNFAAPMAIQFIDPSPGSNPVYALVASTLTGPGNFSISNGALSGALFKR